jgi:hypothetical protein
MSWIRRVMSRLLDRPAPLPESARHLANLPPAPRVVASGAGWAHSRVASASEARDAARRMDLL